MNRKPGRRDHGQDLVQLPTEGVAIRLLEEYVRSGLGVERGYRQRSGQADLKAHVPGDDAFLAQSPKDREGFDSRITVAEIGQCYLARGGDTLHDLVGRLQRIVTARLPNSHLGTLADAGILPADPVIPFADFPIREPLQMRAKMRHGGAKHLLRGSEGRAADEVDTTPTRAHHSQALSRSFTHAVRATCSWYSPPDHESCA